MGFRPSPPLDEAGLRAAALDHLARRSDSAAGLARALARRVQRAAKAGRSRIADAETAIAAVVADLAERGLLSDRRYAESRASHLVRRGRSRLAIQADLAARGVARDDVAAALAEVDAREPDSERAAAIAYARRRRLGPWRDPALRAAKRQADMAALARAGFSGALVRAIIDAPSPDHCVDPDSDTPI